MRRALVAATVGLLAGRPLTSSAEFTPSRSDSLGLETVASVVALFEGQGDAAWPGYDLSLRPFLAYLPGRWAVLVNAPGDVEGFVAYPETWPALGAPALIFRGQLGTLAGQLAFDLDMGGFETAAVPLSVTEGESRRESIGGGLAFIVHEMFHQFQRDAFASVANDLPDEQYLMLDAENTALASVEARLLVDAVGAAARGDSAEARKLAEGFVAVRRARWARSPEGLPAFERPQELMEGTAKYVEVRCVGLMGDLCREGGKPLPGCDVFGAVSQEMYLLSDFEDRLHGGVIAPSDMPRNRMYPVAAATALLLDRFGIEWKDRAADPATSRGFAEMLGEGLGVDPADTDTLLARAKQRYDFAAMLAACERDADVYPRAYRAAVDSLFAAPGYHISVEAPVSGTSRSRSCSGKRLALGGPVRSFSRLCHTYTLRRTGEDDLLVEIHDSGIAEEMSEDGARRSALFVAQGPLAAEIDGVPADLAIDGTRRFDRLDLNGPGFRVLYEGDGTLTVGGTRIAVRCRP